MKLQKGDKLLIDTEEYIFVSHSKDKNKFIVERKINGAYKVEAIKEYKFDEWFSQCGKYQLENEDIFFTLTFMDTFKEMRINCGDLELAISKIGECIQLSEVEKRFKDAGISMNIYGCGCCDSPDIKIEFSDGLKYRSVSDPVSINWNKDE